MKTQLIKNLCKKYFLPSLSGFQVKGNLLYHQDIDYLLGGFCFDSSAFSGSRFTINVFVQPLYIPQKYVTFTYGDRLGHLSQGHDTWWEYTEAQEANISNEILSMMMSAGIPFLEERKSLEKLVHLYDLNDLKGNRSVIEGISYAYVLLEDFAKAKNLLSSFINILVGEAREYPSVTWIIDMQTRVQLILDHLENHNYEKSKQQLDEWRNYTLSNIHL